MALKAGGIQRVVPACQRIELVEMTLHDGEAGAG
jgi:hypothetical protein